MKMLTLGGFVAATAAIGVGMSASDAAQPTIPTYHKDILPILQGSCQSCHRPGQVGPMSLLTYEQVKPWADAIKMRVVKRTMPPWFADPKHGQFLNDRSLKQVDIETISAWVDAGSPEGDAKDAPPPLQWGDQGWLIPPDVVVSLPDYSVPATGVIEWENLALPSPFKEDTWLTSVEVLSSEPSAVHHMCVSFKKHNAETVYNRYEWMEVPRTIQGLPEQSRDRRAETASEGWVLSRDVGSTTTTRRFGRPTIKGMGTFCAVPGQTFRDFRQYNAATLIPAEYSDVVVNLHYTTTGTPLVDRTKIGLTIAKQVPPKKFVEFNASGATEDFAIPPHASSYLAPAIEVTFRREADLVWMLPHMHLRGKDVTYTVIHPSGRREIVLHVPHYNTMWQLGYFIKPLRLLRGAKVHIEAHYDNSSANPHNPDPTTWVYPGQQNWEEMFSGLFAVIVDRGVDDSRLTDSFLRSE